jgi:hypothetical protein
MSAAFVFDVEECRSSGASLWHFGVKLFYSKRVILPWIYELILAIAGPFIILERRELKWLKP